MSRRNSSLVTATLGNLTPDEDTPRPDSTTTVIEIDDNDGFHADDHFSRSTERIFQKVCRVHPLDDLTLESANSNPSDACSKLYSWIRNYRNQISGCFTAKLEWLHNKLETRCEKSYLETYFWYANVCGVSPFRFGKENKPVLWLKKIPYCIVNALAAVDTVRITKIFVSDMIGAHEDGSPQIGLYIFNALVGANILLRVGFFVSLNFQSKKYFKAVQALNASHYRKHLYTVKRLIQSLLVCGLSICVILIQTHIGLLDGLEAYIDQHVELTLSLFCMTRSCQQVNPTGFSTTSVALALFGWATTFAGTMFGQIARDGVFFSAITLGKSTEAFKFKEMAKAADPENGNIDQIGAEIHAGYEDLKKISKRINSAFNVVFRFFLLANIFMFAVFIEIYFNPVVGKVTKIVQSVNVLLVCIAFYYANQASKAGDRFREWMKKEQNRNILGMSQMDVMMENSSSSSIGYGRGALFIYDSTLIGFASVVAAYFLGIVETRPQFKMPCPNNSTLP